MCTPRRSPDSRKQHVDRGAGGVEIHELRLALGRGDFIRAVFVAVPAGEVALIRQVQHQRLQRENRRRVLRRLGRRIARDDGAALRQFAKQADCILGVQAERSEPFDQFLERELTRGQMVQHRGGGAVQLEDRSGGHDISKACVARVEFVELAEAEGSGKGRRHLVTSG